MNPAVIRFQAARARQDVVRLIGLGASPEAIRRAEIERDETLAFLMSRAIAIRADYAGTATENDMIYFGFAKNETSRCRQRAIDLATENAIARNLDVFHYA